MDLNEYQIEAKKTAIYSPEWAVIYPALGLAEEAGEVAGKVKRVVRDDDGDVTPARKEALVKELGDCLWYVANLAHDLGVALEEVAAVNLQKLRDRRAANTIKGEGDSR